MRSEGRGLFGQVWESGSTTKEASASRASRHHFHVATTPPPGDKETELVIDGAERTFLRHQRSAPVEGKRRLPLGETPEPVSDQVVAPAAGKPSMGRILHEIDQIGPRGEDRGVKLQVTRPLGHIGRSERRDGPIGLVQLVGGRQPQL